MAIDRSGGPAFPQLGWEETGGGVFKGQEGLTIRDWYKGIASIGIIIGMTTINIGLDPNKFADTVVLGSAQIADTMIKERER